MTSSIDSNLFPANHFFMFGKTQVRIAGTENTAQYWTNIGSHKLANVTGPISAFKSAQCCPSTGTVHWKSKFSMLALKLGPAMALYWAESRHYSGKPCWKSKTQSLAQERPIKSLKVAITPKTYTWNQELRVWPSNGTLLGWKSALLCQPMLLIYYTRPKVITSTNHLLRRRARVNKFCIKVR